MTNYGRHCFYPPTIREKIKEAAQGRELEILENVAGIPRELLNEKGHPCPKCGGKDRFVLVSRERGSVWCRKCHCQPGGSGDFISAVMWMNNWNYYTAIRAIANYLDM